MNEAAVKLLRELADLLEKEKHTAIGIDAEWVPSSMDPYQRPVYRVAISTVIAQPKKDC